MNPPPKIKTSRFIAGAFLLILIFSVLQAAISSGLNAAFRPIMKSTPEHVGHSRFIEIHDRVTIRADSIVSVVKDGKVITINLSTGPPLGAFDCATQEIADKMFSDLSRELRTP